MNGGDPRLSTNGVLLEETVQRLRDFRTSLLNESLDKLSDETLQRASALLEVVRSSADLDQLLDMNPEILRILQVAFQKSGGDIEEFTRLFREIGQNLVEMEADILSSSSTVQETFRGSRDFNNTLEGDLQEISDSVQESKSLYDFKGFLARRLDGIKVAIGQKRRADEQQLKKANKEIQRLRQHVRQVKQELSRVSIEAESLEKEVLLDPLTGIHNRRAYEKRVREELNRFLNHGQVFSMLLIDIDHFKQVNDRYGHWTGDRCLEEFTKLVKSALRGTDFLARYGGEEFVALLPGTGSEGICTASERIRQIIERARFICRNEEIPITVSIGGTHVKPGDESSETIFNRVDTAMYKAKQSGRNRVILA
jgi:diguanylate cyclase (GGDEF)-like protein